MTTSASLAHPASAARRPRPVSLETGPGTTPAGDRRPRRISRPRRAVDVTVAVAVLAFTLPLLALAALAVRLDGPGPVLRRTPHAGLGGAVFNLLSLRSAEAPWHGAAPRPTRVGRILRPVRLDQLPVLLNLLRGDLTLVGPAPRPLDHVGPGRTAADETPGVTGWATVE